MKLGASGYLSKDAADRELVKAINNILDGRKYVSQAISDKLVSMLDSDIELSISRILQSK